MSGSRLIPWFFIVPLFLSGTGCNSPEGPPPTISRPEISRSEWERRLAEVEELSASGSSEAALEKIRGSMDLWPPPEIRRQLQQAAVRLRRDLFYQEHPLHLDLVIPEQERFFGEEIDVQLRITNLGREKIVFPKSHRGWWDALTFQDPEDSLMLLKIKVIDSNGRASSWAGERTRYVDLEEDLELLSGQSSGIGASVEQNNGDGVLVRQIQLSAVFRPIAIISDGGDRRYDALEFPVGSTRVFHERHLPWARGGVDLLRTSVEGEAVGPSEAIFVAAMGLKGGDLREGIDVLVRAAPSLEAERQSCVLAALRSLTGRSFAGDPVRFLGWWNRTGKLASDGELQAWAGLSSATSGGLLIMGGQPMTYTVPGMLRFVTGSTR